jgi:tetraacyldisaccharide 4'-kinase
LPDHYAYKGAGPFTDIAADAILITAKDAVKCARFHDPRLWVVHAATRFSDPHWVKEIDRRLRILATAPVRH